MFEGVLIWKEDFFFAKIEFYQTYFTAYKSNKDVTLVFRYRVQTAAAVYLHISGETKQVVV